MVAIHCVNMAAAVFYVPYGIWQFATLETLGRGHAPADQFTLAASQNQRYLVKAFLRNGVAIDSSNSSGQTALDDACLSGQLDMARFLISRGAQLDRSPACRKVPEFAARMKPLPPPARDEPPQIIVVKPSHRMDCHAGPPRLRGRTCVTSTILRRQKKGAKDNH